jgi:SAM-dependent methyltransferase
MPADTRLLEVGAGQGAVSARLSERCDYLGVEADATSAAVARDRVEPNGGRVLVGAAEEVVGEPTVDAVVAFEVLEHLEDDVAALRRWAKWLRPGGRLVLSVPAQPHRFGPWDEAVGHYRRYTRDSLEEALVEAGFEPIGVWSYGWPLGYALETVRNRLADPPVEHEASMEERTAGSGRRFQPGTAFAPLTWLVTLPFRILQVPFARTRLGTGLVAAARWPGLR